MAEELRANLKGLKALKNIGYKTPLAAKLRMLAPTATYLQHAGLLVATPIAVLKGLEYYNKLRDEGRAPTLKELWRVSPKTLATLPTKEELKSKWERQLR